MTLLSRGLTHTLTALFFSAPNVPSAVAGLTLNVISLQTGGVVLGPIVAGFGNPALGIYTYPWAIPAALPTGDYLVNWNGTIGLDAISASETVTVIGNTSSTSGPCQPYDFTLLCPLPTGSEALTGVALDAATELLFYATAQRFDTCQVTIRPCRRDCYGAIGTWGYNAGWWWDGSYPVPANINGLWYNLTCGVCGDTCSCTSISETVLPGPVRSIVQVKVNGVVLTEGVDYRLDDYRKLVRLGDVWPLCNDLNKDDTEQGTWSITAIYGESLPALGKLATGELMNEILKDMMCGACALPSGVTNITRQGVSMTLEAANELVESDLFNLKYVDRFIRTYNPHHLMARAAVYDIDGPSFRLTGTS